MKTNKEERAPKKHGVLNSIEKAIFKSLAPKVSDEKKLIEAIDKIKKEENLDFYLEQEDRAGRPPAYFMPNLKGTILQKAVPADEKIGRDGKIGVLKGLHESFYLHELGHLKMFKDSKNKAPRLLARSLGPYVGIGAGLAASHALKSSKNKTAKSIAALLPLIGTIPTIIEEGGASVHAIKDTHKYFGAKETAKAIPTLAAGLATYLLTPGITSYALHKNFNK